MRTILAVSVELGKGEVPFPRPLGGSKKWIHLCALLISTPQEYLSPELGALLFGSSPGSGFVHVLETRALRFWRLCWGPDFEKLPCSTGLCSATV